MIEEKLVLENKLGLHARAAAKLVQLNEHFNSEIKISKGSVEANGKSILGVLLLAAPLGTELTFKIKGDDEKEAFESIKMLIKNKFNEDE